MQRGLTEDILFLACTRPAMWRGVPIEAAAINGMATMIVFIMAGNPFYMLIGVLFHFIIRALISKDYNAFGVMNLWLKTKARATNRLAWGGSSVSPLHIGPARVAREVRIHV